MATSYEAVVRLAPVNVAPEREAGIVQLIGQDLPTGSRVVTERDENNQLLLTVALRLLGADTSEVQLEALDIVRPAAVRAGFTEQAALLEDVVVRANS